ncbi:MAG: hypothetical protein DWQ31_01215 [Planctomycetota bacterium]|nr:MAG: hypothetical protein DWQ31_01215 [Planctomycetota bacterium]REJ90912.1 MAG: hypothetical protein DWQ35_15625 [Planctomycetota bacterium]REK17689.1 MAG: hypothetical protein DWQ42_21840 [Planctomycetota bacterium]REK46742.1 MAG: hypothetical protein DWQ46_05950 [Planctomycetota bacterium]
MPAPSPTSSSVIEVGAGLLLDASVKGFVVLALTAIVIGLIRRLSAAERHLAWSTAIFALLSLPFFCATMPSWLILPAWHTVSSASVSPITAPPPVSGQEDRPKNEVSSKLRSQADIDEIDDRSISADQIVGPGKQLAVRQQIDSQVSRLQPIVVWLLAIWMAGVVACLIPALLGQMRLTSLRRSSHPVTDATCLSMLATASEQLALSRRVTLLESDRCTIPMVWGIRRPVLLFPSDRKGWSDDRCEIVLMHELAHVKRWDILFKMLAQLARAVYWFNPLAWFAVRRIDIESELACDDLVLGVGRNPADYAQQLLDITSAIPSRRLEINNAMTIVRRSMIEGRVRSILSNTQCRRRQTTMGLFVAVTLVFGVSVVLASVRSETEEPDTERAISGEGLESVATASGTDDRARSNERSDYRRPVVTKHYSAFPFCPRVGDGDVLFPDCAAFSPDGRRVVVAGGGGSFAWHSEIIGAIKNGVIVNEDAILEVTPIAFSGHVMDVAFSPDGQYLAGIGVDPHATNGVANITGIHVEIFDGHTLKKVRSLRSDVFPFESCNPRAFSISWSPDGNSLAASYKDTRVWNVQAGKLLLELSGVRGPVRFCEQGKSLVTYNSTTGSLDFYDAGIGQRVRQIDVRNYRGGVTSLVVSPDEQWIAITGPTVYKKNVVCVVSRDGEKQHKREQERIWEIAFTPDSRAVTIGFHSLKDWYFLDGGATENYAGHLLEDTIKDVEQETPEQFPFLYTALAHSPDGTKLAAGRVLLFTGGFAGGWGFPILVDRSSGQEAEPDAETAVDAKR